jgi:tetratricopeptide (TPR) repeat protein
MRRQTKWVFAFLAVVFAGSFVFLGVGSGGSALTDFLNGNIHIFGSGGGPSVKSLQKKVAKDPANTSLRLQLAQLLAKDGRYDESVAAYRKYLKFKPRDTSAMGELANVYASQAAALQSEVQSPPTPSLAALSGVSPLASTSTLGKAVAALQPTPLSVSSLQQGETIQLGKQLDRTIRKHVDELLKIASFTPADSSAFREAAVAAGTDGDIPLQISLDQQFLRKYPGDPLAPDIRNEIKSLENQLAAGQTSSPSQTIPGTTVPAG